MIRQHEEERARIWRELHDETAQVLAALNLQLGRLRSVAMRLYPALDRQGRSWERNSQYKKRYEKSKTSRT